ncbi:hypothetical protein NHX12_011305 [Muraenolepis orangiensis]|uniref:Uncharacterized protein n=1 Tax=Muraenolepis orangiensis TaxID=630683 RepID=A0A9Q0DFW3_9TELE|nr:hypothetical protein NHX12_011305 [Muraenolepis orangiensis]
MSSHCSESHSNEEREALEDDEEEQFSEYEDLTMSLKKRMRLTISQHQDEPVSSHPLDHPLDHSLDHP